MPRRRSFVAVLLALATGCSTATGHPSAAPVSTTTTVPPPTTATAVLLPSDIQDLIVTSTMTDRGRRLFLAADPTIEDVATFTRACGVDSRPDSATEARTHTQGCYVAGRIHLLAPDRAEAHDLLYVVAAHEMLHAAYGSLSAAERARVDAESEAARAANSQLNDRLKPYGATPTLDNEIHSILGSEFDGLSAALEAHYAQFFTKRSVLVAFRQRTLGAREDEMKRLKADLDDLDGRIDALRADQEKLRAANDVGTFNANVPVVNGLINRYNGEVDTLNALIDDYNALLGA